jgi:hypothetical protein
VRRLLRSSASEQTPLRCFFAYATATAVWYARDIKNLLQLAALDPGVEKVELYIAISEVRKRGLRDRMFADRVRELFRDHPRIELVDLSFKSNRGRDFSSYARIFRLISEVAAETDYVMFQNRSACGPLSPDWYRQYIDQYLEFDRVGLCGATISFADHPRRSRETNRPHVQTYAFLTQVGRLLELKDRFPGERAEERLDAILEGELGLSESLLDKGLRLTCMEWPHAAIDRESNAADFATEDVRTQVSGQHAFLHRCYLRKHRLRYATPATSLRFLLGRLPVAGPY